ncbi:hypothetical protein BGW37DRAFT_468988 [Umbelopsis sp. PMI_123]|nr:hypothetical protein BGW37DRAFT_468988 [Umbelopsis sp. PMI_123]
MTTLCNFLNVSQRFAPDHHPQSNGTVERPIATFRDMITSYIEKDADEVNWDKYLGPLSSSLNACSAKLIRAWKGPYQITWKIGSDRYDLKKSDRTLVRDVHAFRFKTFYE